jgi:hypothetical protein
MRSSGLPAAFGRFIATAYSTTYQAFSARR